MKNEKYQEILDKTKDKLNNNPGKIMYRWLSAIYRENDLFSRLDKVFLYCLFLCKGEPRYCKIVGFPEKQNGGTSDENILYTTETVYRVKDGSRRGRIFNPGDLFHGESVEVAGIHKYLELSDVPARTDHLHPSRGNDSYMLRLLEELVEVSVMEVDDFIHPEFYLCSRSAEDIRLRMDTDSIGWLSSMRGYSPTDSLDRNVRNLAPQSALFAGTDKNGNNRQAFPYRYFTGRGVRTASREFNGQWYMTDVEASEVKKPFLRCSFPGAGT